jgi:hypothetical protein
MDFQTGNILMNDMWKEGKSYMSSEIYNILSESRIFTPVGFIIREISKGKWDGLAI